ncbi:MAG: hypothetical protein A4E65_00239 [Syntrophorhabdus sp. PtaU1.Bin153]|nr:MAG: hypothetical protein A4E65_00239 [Syntrophorhabdus sp. PtaU1.Bin153]
MESCLGLSIRPSRWLHAQNQRLFLRLSTGGFQDREADTSPSSDNGVPEGKTLL